MAKDQQLEVWENPNNCIVGIAGLDHRGNMAPKVVSPHRRVNVTPEERELTESMAVSDALNPFRNGLLRPVRLVETHDFQPVEITENQKSDEELKALLSKSGVAFTNSLKNIDSPLTLGRLHALTEEHGSVKQVAAVKARLEQVAPELTKVDVNSSIPEDKRKEYI